METVPLTGSAKFLDVTATPDGPGAFAFDVANPLAAQGQHFIVRLGNATGWSVHGAPDPAGLDGGASTSFELHVTADGTATEPLRIDLVTDIGGLRPFYAFAAPTGIQLTEDPSLAVMTITEETQDTPAPLPFLAVALALLVLRRRRA